MSAETEIKAVLDARRAAVESKDAQASVAHYASDIVLFDLPPPLSQPRSEIVDPGRAQQWFDTWEGEITTDLRDLVIKVEGNLAFAYGLLHMSGKRTDGSEGNFWSRTTICLERRGGEWSILHDHNSFPMLMDGSGKSATDLRP